MKGGREHWLGLPRQVDEILARLRILAGKSAFILASRKGESGHLATVQKSHGRLNDATGLDFRIHDIRRTVATKLGALGITDDVVPRVLSHSAGGGGAAITRRHYNLAQQIEPTLAALQALSDHLDAIISGKPGEEDETGKERAGNRAGKGESKDRTSKASGVTP